MLTETRNQLFDTHRATTADAIALLDDTPPCGQQAPSLAIKQHPHSPTHDGTILINGCCLPKDHDGPHQHTLTWTLQAPPSCPGCDYCTP